MKNTRTKKVAEYESEWVDLKSMPDEYNIDLEVLAEAIEERKIRTRGRVYDDISQFGDVDSVKATKHVEIAPETWSDYILEEILPKNDKTAAGFLFLYGFNHTDFLGKPRVQQYKTGYVDIRVFRKDFEDKIKIKTLGKGKRVHKQIENIRTLYDKYLERHGFDTASPKEFLEDIRDIDSESDEEIFEFEIEYIEEDQDNFRKSIIHYTGEGRKGRKMTVGRFYNIISRFNNPDK